MMKFWKHLILYISNNLLSSIPFDDGEVQTMLNPAKDVVECYDNMQNHIPK